MMSAIGQEPSPDPRTGAQQRRAGHSTVGTRISAAQIQFMLELGLMPTARSADRRFDAHGSFNSHHLSSLIGDYLSRPDWLAPVRSSPRGHGAGGEAGVATAG